MHRTITITIIKTITTCIINFRAKMQKSKKAEFALSEELKTDEEWDDAMQKQVCCLVV